MSHDWTELIAETVKDLRVHDSQRTLIRCTNVYGIECAQLYWTPFSPRFLLFYQLDLYLNSIFNGNQFCTLCSFPFDKTVFLGSGRNIFAVFPEFLSHCIAITTLINLVNSR